jgi:hypothetical protein
MNTGMLWFDNSDAELETKISKAAAYYEKKYGKKPDTVLVHPSEFDKDTTVEGLTIRSYRPVLPGRIWIGIEE